MPNNPPVLIPLSLYGHMSVSIESAKRIIGDGRHNPYFEEAIRTLQIGVHWIAS